jgi:hypothetical protein
MHPTPEGAAMKAEATLIAGYLVAALAVLAPAVVG